MPLKELIRQLRAMGFEPAPGAAAYAGTTRFDHWRIERESSVFAGDGPSVTCGGQTTILNGSGAFLIANGRSEPKGMAQRLLRLDAKPTGRIKDPGGRPPVGDDPYWRDSTDLPRLLAKMENYFD